MKLIRPILIGGVIAGALDILYACIHYGVALGASPARVCQSVASGILGKDAAVAGGLETAALGLGLHFMMAIMMSGFFVLLASRIAVLARYAWITGPIYGLGLYFVMNYVVVPLSNAAHNGAPEGQFLVGALFTHIVLVGLPIALIAKRYQNVHARQ
jgi:uncharacterized membrane protein YagU involved in acid resistance